MQSPILESKLINLELPQQRCKSCATASWGSVSAPWSIIDIPSEWYLDRSSIEHCLRHLYAFESIKSESDPANINAPQEMLACLVPRLIAASYFSLHTLSRQVTRQIISTLAARSDIMYLLAQIEQLVNVQIDFLKSYRDEIISIAVARIVFIVSTFTLSVDIYFENMMEDVKNIGERQGDEFCEQVFLESGPQTPLLGREMNINAQNVDGTTIIDDLKDMINKVSTQQIAALVPTQSSRNSYKSQSIFVEFSTPESFLRALGVFWTERILLAPFLCVVDEYERYKLLKRVYDLELGAELVVLDASETAKLNELEMNDAAFKRGADHKGPHFSSDENVSDNFLDQQNIRPSTICNLDASKVDGEPKQSIFGSFISSFLSKKRKISPSSPSKDFLNSIAAPAADLEPRLETPLTAHPRRPIKLPRSIAASRFTENKLQQGCSATHLQKWIRLFDDSNIIYTFMTFSQLEAVKRDAIVPGPIVLQSYWQQQELANPIQISDKMSKLKKSVAALDMAEVILVENGSIVDPAGLATIGISTEIVPVMETPPFRFAAKFTGITETLISTSSGTSTTPISVYSDPVMCAGVQYRLLLTISEQDGAGMARESKTAKALLQRSKGTNMPDMTYSIYLIDYRFSMDADSLAAMQKPVTKCDSGGNGYAKDILAGVEDHGIKHALFVDELWLIAHVTMVI